MSVPLLARSALTFALIAICAEPGIGATTQSQKPESLDLSYRFGWGGIDAATATIKVRQKARSESTLHADVHTSGIARLLWALDATYDSRCRLSRNPRPVEATQKETYRDYVLHTEVDFFPDRIERRRWREPGETRQVKPKVVRLADVDSYESAIFRIRDARLETGDTVALRVHPGTNPFLFEMTVRGRQPLTVRAGRFNAIKVDVRLRKIERDGSLTPNTKVRRVTAWLSDDFRRIPLRIEAEVFIGAVFAELTEVR